MPIVMNFNATDVEAIELRPDDPAKIKDDALKVVIRVLPLVIVAMGLAEATDIALIRRTTIKTSLNAVGTTIAVGTIATVDPFVSSKATTDVKDALTAMAAMGETTVPIIATTTTDRDELPTVRATATKIKINIMYRTCTLTIELMALILMRIMAECLPMNRTMPSSILMTVEATDTTILPILMTIDNDGGQELTNLLMNK